MHKRAIGPKPLLRKRYWEGVGTIYTVSHPDTHYLGYGYTPVEAYEQYERLMRTDPCKLQL